MIPLRLHIKNFLSYGSPTQTVNFEPYHLICLSGKNGHGKSALLDALTWSLWGQARKATGATRSDDHLLRMGSTRMMVALDFMCNRRTYRVRREYQNEDAKNMTYLDFGIYDESKEQWCQLTTKSLRDTQELIIATIGLTAEAFENSAFLRQGHSDEFSRKSPKDRKEMLANILGLGAYEVLRKKSVDTGKEEQIRYQNSMRSCDLLRLTVTPYQQVKQDLKTLTEQYALHEKRDQELLAALIIVRKELTQLYQESQKLHGTLAVEAHLINRRTTLGEELRALWNTWHTLNTTHRALSTKQPFQKDRALLFKEIEAVQKDVETHVELSQQIVQLTANLHIHRAEQQHAYESARATLLLKKNSLEQHRSTLEQNTHHLQERYHELTQTLQTLHKQHSGLIPTTADFAGYESTYTLLEKQHDMTSQALQRTTMLHKQLTRDTQRIMHAQTIFKQTQQPTCISCSQPIPTAYLTRIERIYGDKIARYTHQGARLCKLRNIYQTRNNEVIYLLQQSREHYKQSLQQQSRYELYCTRSRELTQNRAILEQQLQELTRHQAQITQECQQIDQQVEMVEQQHHTANNNDAKLHSLERQISDYERQLQQTVTAHTRYQELQTELTQLATEDLQRTHIAQEIQTQSERRQTIQKFCRELRTIKTQQQQLEPIRATYQKVALHITEQENYEQRLQHERSQLLQTKEQLATQQGALEQSLRHIEHNMNLLAHEKKQAKIHEDNATDYNLLAQILSKDGVQGMLIEHVLPEIEHEANILLAKLTDNQAQLHFESLRSLKNGALKETLDIKIADSLGLRPYELFSGGEAFRIDLALRLAISKLLAHRAGASVQTLIIDEGFGSQDEEGLHHIMESIYAIQSEFSKIIIVSHLPSMKDQFPVHFSIYKGMQGSIVQLVEQG